jgi:hypothetical protein
MQIRAMIMEEPYLQQRPRFSVKLELADYEAPLEFGAAQRPPLMQQCLKKLAVKNPLDQHENRQPSCPLKQP